VSLRVALAVGPIKI